MKSIVSSQMLICNDPTPHNIGVFPDKEQAEQLDAIAMLKGMGKNGILLIEFYVIQPKEIYGELKKLDSFSVLKGLETQ